MNDVMFSSKTDDWATPQELFDRLDSRYHFTLDPACTHENAKCARHFTVEEDGLAQDWGVTRSSAIPLTDASWESGSKRLMRKPGSRTHWW